MNISKKRLLVIGINLAIIGAAWYLGKRIEKEMEDLPDPEVPDIDTDFFEQLIDTIDAQIIVARAALQRWESWKDQEKAEEAAERARRAGSLADDLSQVGPEEEGYPDDRAEQIARGEALLYDVTQDQVDHVRQTLREDMVANPEKYAD